MTGKSLIFALLLLSPAAQAQQVITPNTRAPLSPEKEKIHGTLVTLRDSLLVVQTAGGRLERDLRSSSDAVLRSRARSISAACASSSRAAASAQQTVTASPEPAKDPKKTRRHCWPPSRTFALPSTSARRTSPRTSTRPTRKISGDTESAGPARRTTPSSATGSLYSSTWAYWTSLSTPNSAPDPPHRNLRVLTLLIHISTSCGDARYLPCST